MYRRLSDQAGIDGVVGPGLAAQLAPMPRNLLGQRLDHASLQKTGHVDVAPAAPSLGQHGRDDDDRDSPGSGPALQRPGFRLVAASGDQNASINEQDGHSSTWRPPRPEHRPG